MRVAITGDRPESPALTALESELLRVALAPGQFAGLRAQAEGAQVVSRTRSGVGFVTRLRVAPDLPRTELAGVPAVYGRHPLLEEPAEFLLQLKDGRLHTIEAFCFQGLWPDDEAGFHLQGGAQADAERPPSR